MKKPKYIKANNLPPRFGLVNMLVWWLILDHFKAPGWAYGVIYTLLVTITICEIWRTFAGDAIDVLGNDAEKS